MLHSKWKRVEDRGSAQLWKRPGREGPRFMVTAPGQPVSELPGNEGGYPNAETAWQAFEVRRGIAREIDMNHM